MNVAFTSSRHSVAFLHLHKAGSSNVISKHMSCMSHTGKRISTLLHLAQRTCAFLRFMTLRTILLLYTILLVAVKSCHLFCNILYMLQFSWVFLFFRSPLLGSLCPTLKKCSRCSCGENLFPDECDPCLWRHVLPLSCRLKKPLDFSILSSFLLLHSFTFHLPHSIYLLPSFSRKKLHSLQRILYFF